ncbi:Lhr family helicase [Martelella alba]|uniref:Lhr family helicase n=1 Tax=Martelella alba TaxID=2590451 RepID=UPI001E3A0BCE|nr:hypothetical protein [Martelella alba]
MAGRWSLPGEIPASPTVRLLTLAERLLDRYGVISRSVATAERVPGGFSPLLSVLRRVEDAGRVLRGRFVAGLGAAQFADKDSIERLRELAQTTFGRPLTAALSAGDPANPFGWLLSWPHHPSGIRPARRGGAIVVIRNGDLALYLGQGGRQMLIYPGAESALDGGLDAVLRALAAALKRERRRVFTLESIDGRPADASPMASALSIAGFSRVPRGYAWYG